MKNSIFKFLSHPVLLGALKLFLGIVFIISSATKIPNPEKFAEAIAAYRIVPEIFLPAMSFVIPWIQLLCGALLVCDIYVKSSSLILSGLLTVYTLAIVSAVARGLDIDCGCFDLLIEMGEKVGIEAILRDIFFLLLSLILFFFDKNDISVYGLKKKFLNK